MSSTFLLNRAAISEYCQGQPIQRLSLFGSVLGNDFGPESDVDMLVELEPKARVGMLQLVGIEIELTNLVGRKVDLRTSAELSRYFRDEVLSSAETVYEHEG